MLEYFIEPIFIKVISFYILYIYLLCVCAWECVCGGVQHTCGSQRIMCECRLPFHHVGCGSNSSCAWWHLYGLWHFGNYTLEQ